MDQEQEHSEVHGHEHEDVLVIPSWVPWALTGVFVGLAVVVAWDVYKQRRTTAKLLNNVRTEAATVIPVLDLQKVEEWANKAGKDEQPESPPL